MQSPKTTNKTYEVTAESFECIFSYWRDDNLSLNWNAVFVLPDWLKIWWQHFCADHTQLLLTVRDETTPIGIAPLMTRENKAYLIGSINVCDYLDFIVAPGRELSFFKAILDYLKHTDIQLLDLLSVRPDSTVYTHLIEFARKQGLHVTCKQVDVSQELDLPSTWDEYLDMLNGKQRHEIRRKIRRLHEAATINYRPISTVRETLEATAIFFELFTQSREDKAEFMTHQMRSFFNAIINALSHLDILKFNVLEIDNNPAAMIMCFEYNETIYLYNNGFDNRYRNLSVGSLCKALSIKESIQQGKKRYDFLKGAEVYKQRMGGKEVPLFRCQIRLQ